MTGCISSIAPTAFTVPLASGFTPAGGAPNQPPAAPAPSVSQPSASQPAPPDLSNGSGSGSTSLSGSNVQGPPASVSNPNGSQQPPPSLPPAVTKTLEQTDSSGLAVSLYVGSEIVDWLPVAMVAVTVLSFAVLSDLAFGDLACWAFEIVLYLVCLP